MQSNALAAAAVGIAAGPDNNIWVTTTIGVTKIDPATALRNE